MLIIHLFKIIGIKLFYKKNIERDVRILLSIIQTLADYYYIFGYYIFGCDHPTENEITENVIHSTKTCIKEGLGQNRLDGVWRREGESITCELMVY